MLLYELELAEQPAEWSRNGRSVTALRLSAEPPYKLFLQGVQDEPLEFASLTDVKAWLRRNGVKCRHVFATECAYGMGLDEAAFKELLSD